MEKDSLAGIQANPEKLLNLLEKPKLIPEFLTIDQQHWLIEYFKKNKVSQNLHLDLLHANQDLAELLTKLIEPILDLSRLNLNTCSFINLITSPGPHIDSILVQTGIYAGYTDLSFLAGKQLFIPLSVDDRLDWAPSELFTLATIYMNQRWFGYGTNFLRRNPARAWINSFKHRLPIDDYSIGGIGFNLEQEFDKELHTRYFKNSCYREQLLGMTIERIVCWKLRQASIFDTNQIHAATDMSSTCFTSKLFLNVFLTVKDPTIYL